MEPQLITDTGIVSEPVRGTSQTSKLVGPSRETGDTEEPVRSFRFRTGRALEPVRVHRGQDLLKHWYGLGTS